MSGQMIQMIELFRSKNCTYRFEIHRGMFFPCILFAECRKFHGFYVPAEMGNSFPFQYGSKEAQEEVRTKQVVCTTSVLRVRLPQKKKRGNFSHRNYLIFKKILQP